MKKSFLLCVMVFALSLLDAQNQKDEAGVIVNQTREVPAFSVVKSISFVDVVIIRDSSRKLVVTADENIIKHIFTEVDQGVLTISMENHTSFINTKILVEVHTPHLAGVVNIGTGDMTIKSLEEETFSLHNKGTGNVSSSSLLVKKGLVVKNSGTGEVVISYSTRGDVTIASNGTGDIVMTALKENTERITVLNTGTGDVILKKLSVGNLQARNQGTGDLIFSGKADNMTLENKSVGNIQAEKLTVKLAYITQNGVGNVSAHVTGTTCLSQSNKVGSVTITGGGKVIYP